MTKHLVQGRGMWLVLLPKVRVVRDGTTDKNICPDLDYFLEDSKKLEIGSAKSE